MKVIEMKSNTFSKMLIGISITTSLIILVFFAAIELGVENIDLENILVALLAGSIGVLIGLMINIIVKE
ncbi:hypothetical protein OX283_011585 [Flavobacterium sp. SUN052]|uniref:hypothetical protein n=1 Tax=Flavobacterium sp. SUN052 TaxID=3002441 RepID=UPI00237D4C09|nr:hypothetical protein [Flavobacterium sp. SUN052]MEC4005299.1 hypothetical protein [Flavobacterium sp. SUN052]